MFRLHCETPEAWLKQSKGYLPLLLSDHAHCERKAAQAALSLMVSFTDNPSISMQLAKLAREEIRHYEQVLSYMKQLNIAHQNRTSCRYAKCLHAQGVKHGPTATVDKLLIAAIIEARSCERFQVLSSVLEEPLRSFYHKLWLAERRHAIVYVEFAKTQQSDIVVEERLQALLAYEANLIMQPEECFRFHSGIPMQSLQVA